jgi:hypothetical protein
MADRQPAWEAILVLILIALVVLTRFADFNNADISLLALVTAILTLVISIAGKHQIPN